MPEKKAHGRQSQKPNAPVSLPWDRMRMRTRNSGYVAIATCDKFDRSHLKLMVKLEETHVHAITDSGTCQHTWMRCAVAALLWHGSAH